MIAGIVNGLAHLIGLHVSRHRPDRENLPAFADPEFLDLYRRNRNATMTTWTGCHQTWLAARYVARAGVAGDIVECGVYKGGLSILMAETFKRHGADDRKVWMYDTFAGMTEPTDDDFARHDRKPAASWMRESEKVRAIGPRDIVTRNIKCAAYPPSQFVMVEGRVEDTIPGRVPEKISLLRLDTDWYESTRHELEHLFPLLSPGGVLIVDDYGIWDGARKAADEYLAAHGICPISQDTDYGAILAIKH